MNDNAHAEDGDAGGDLADDGLDGHVGLLRVCLTCREVMQRPKRGSTRLNGRQEIEWWWW